jgi:phosphoribosyl-AMP cyclohydrolase
MNQRGLSPSVQQLLKDPDSLIPAIAQDHVTGKILMMAWMNQESLALTLETRKATYWSRSRNELWVKGATSGHFQSVKEVWLDCDGDALLISVEQVGSACHTGEQSCFHQNLLELSE